MAARVMLVVNPVSDGAFVERVRLLRDGHETPDAFQSALRAYYPDALVRSRDLDGEAPTWYVYRDGRWTPSSPVRSDGAGE